MRVILLPGMGADARLFGGVRACLPHLEVLDWIEPFAGEPLPSYAERMARRIDGATPFVLGGVSMGGMVAAEMLQHVRPRGLVLVSSATSNDCVARFAALRPLLRTIPPNALAKLAGTRPMIRALCGPLSQEHRALFRVMLRDTPPAFLRWSLLALLDWAGADIGAVPVLRVHGARDRAIALPVSKGVRVIDSGGHLCVLTHARDTAEAISDWAWKLK